MKSPNKQLSAAVSNFEDKSEDKQFLEVIIAKIETFQEINLYLLDLDK